MNIERGFDSFGLLAYANGDEYDVLLRFAADEAAKLDHGDDAAEGEEDVQYTRPWYAPWKKVKKESLKEKKVRLPLSAPIPAMRWGEY